ncbi:winged helix-turn-helix domain-containing protein [Candidatus Bathyarchaeota archaeon]|nr:winged helix-turn-helix domain-containing protein [Candidatus Bathyarchaeota archaeon]
MKRSRIEIYFEIPRVTHQGISKPTQIMYKANLSWKHSDA